MKATILFQTSLQLEVYTQNYGPPKSLEFQFWEFRDSHLGVSRQNDIWVLVPWLGTKYTIWGKVVVSPKSGPWWVLWVCVCSWFVHEPKMLKLRTNQLVVWFVQVHVSNWLLITLPSPHPEALTHPSTPKVLRTRERAPTPYFSAVFTHYYKMHPSSLWVSLYFEWIWTFLPIENV
jgi:hypothetical protein